MLKLSKKLVALLMVALLAITSMMGCSRKEQEELDEEAVLMTIGETEVTVGMVNFYVRYQQSLVESVYQSYLGDDVWRQEMEDGVTYEENMKDTIMDALQELYIIAEHKVDYSIELTEVEVKDIEDAAANFADANSKDAKAKASAKKEYAEEYLTLFLINDKMEDAMRKDIDTDLSNEDETQKRMRYISFDFSTTENGTTTELSDDEIKELKKEAQAFLDGAKANGSLEAYATEKEATTYTLTFDEETTGLDEKVMEAANALKENEFAELIEAEDGYYVVQLESEYDVDATDEALEAVLEERGETRYNELLEKWKEETKVEVNKELWNKISLDALKINSVTPEAEEEETTDDTTTDDTTTDDTATDDTATTDTTTDDSTATE